MPTFSASDGTPLAYQVTGEGRPLICLPGGPMQASAYLGDLGGLAADRQLVMLDLRGTGRSAAPQDPASYRCDRLVDDVTALRDHLGLDRVELLAHSAGANLAVSYAARHPGTMAGLVLVTPSVFAVGLTIDGELRREMALLRKDEPWFPTAFEALREITSDRATDEAWQAISPFFHGRWDERAQAHQAAGDRQKNHEAAAVFGAEGAFDPEATRAALAAFEAPVLLLAGEVDMAAPPRTLAAFAQLFPNAELAVQQGAGHYPWLDDPDAFAATVTAFLG
ncbi:alpha/beta fold hydrolase [Streptomyces hundungensis]|uniref:alpha/beta fold hydrolase n=1 Tax=Streptomyces hundungensis TaxID=1077946 RepID=UPI0033EE1170